MPEVSDAVIFLADLNDARPWWREEFGSSAIGS